MASTRIKYDSHSTVGGTAIAGLVNTVISQSQLADRIKGNLDAMVGSNPPDYVALETEFGLDAGQGQIFYNVLVNLKVNLAAACSELVRLDKVI